MTNHKHVFNGSRILFDGRERELPDLEEANNASYRMFCILARDVIYRQGIYSRAGSRLISGL